MKNSDKPIHPLQDLGFPSNQSVIQEDTMFGLTKREYFAAMAMQGLIISQGEKNMVNNWGVHGTRISENAIHIADELLKELEKPIL